MSLDIITRAAWGARRRKSAPDTVRPAERRATMAHYSTGEELGREDTAEWVRQIQSHHMDVNGWQDIGYNFLVDREGRVFEGRGWDAVGAHCAGYNTPAVGVCFLGDDDPGQDVPNVARAAILELHREGMRRAGHQLAQLGHRDKYPTKCPGDELYSWWTGGAKVAAPTSSTARDDGSRAVAPPFPLPAGRWFGPGDVMHSHYLGQWQRQMARRGWRIAVDGDYGPQTRAVALAFGAEKKVPGGRDDLIGRNMWAAAFTEPVTR